MESPQLISPFQSAADDMPGPAALVAASAAQADDLAEDDAIFRYSFRQAAVALALVDLTGRFLLVNRAMCELLGYEETELQGRDFYSITHREDINPGREALARFHDGQCRSACLTKRYVHKSGRDVHAQVSISLVHDDAGDPLHFCVHVQDVTERRRAALLESDRRQVLEMVAQDQALPSTLHQLVRLLERQMPGMMFCVMLLRDGALRSFAPNLPKDFAEAIARKPVSFAAKLAAGPIGRGAPPRVSDVQSDPAWDEVRAEARDAGVACGWAGTFAGGDAVPLGMLVVFSRENRPPNRGECAVLDIAARLATVAVEHHLTTRQLAHLVHHDALTGLPNRILFEDRLHHSIATARRTGKPLALLAMDLNRFKQVNDTMGHHAGDSLLQQFSHRVRTCLRESDTLARVGGDEFMLILPDLEGREEAEVVAIRIREKLANVPFEIGGQSVIGSCSIGIALHPADGEDALLLQRAADAAMYRVKQQGRRGGAALADDSPG